MLITDATKNLGQILLGGKMRPTRERFTLAHEFGHFLLPHHRQMQYECSNIDINQGDKGKTPEAEREWEANRFAAELMLPKQQFLKRLGKTAAPCLSHVQRLSTAFNMSVEATARRYLGLAGFPCCLVFSQNGIVSKHPAKSPDFNHWLSISPRQKVPKLSTAASQGDGLDDFNEIAADEWLETEKRQTPDFIQEQTLYQEDGYAITLLWLDDTSNNDDGY